MHTGTVNLRAAQWALTQSQSGPTGRLVLLALAYHANAKGRAWPSVPTLARETALNRGTVQRALRDLEDLGELTVELRDGRSSTYTLVDNSTGGPHSARARSGVARALTSKGAAQRADRSARSAAQKKQLNYKERAPLRSSDVPGSGRLEPFVANSEPVDRESNRNGVAEARRAARDARKAARS